MTAHRHMYVCRYVREWFLKSLVIEASQSCLLFQLHTTQIMVIEPCQNLFTIFKASDSTQSCMYTLGVVLEVPGYWSLPILLVLSIAHYTDGGYWTLPNLIYSFENSLCQWFFKPRRPQVVTCRGRPWSVTLSSVGLHRPYVPSTTQMADYTKYHI